jgi:hypothetical protein
VVGTIVDYVDRKRVVRGHGAKGRWHKGELKASKDPIVVKDVGWKNLPQP